MPCLKKRYPFLAALILVLVTAACKGSPPPKLVSAVCNPVPVDPPLPNFIESITYQGPAVYGPVHSLHAVGDTVYLGVGNSFAVLDATDAAEPQLVGSVYLDGYGQFGYDMSSIHNGIAQLSTLTKTFGDIGYILDLSNPNHPVSVHCNPPIPSPGQATFANKYEISNRGLGGISIREWAADGSNTREVSTFNLHTQPQLEWSQLRGQLIPSPNMTQSEPMKTADFTVDDRYLYLLSLEYNSGTYCCSHLTILDLENLADPENINSIKLPNATMPTNILAVGDFLLITFNNWPANMQTTIYDVKDKGELNELVTVSSSHPPQAHNGVAYFPTWSDSRIDIWDLNEVEQPQFVGNIIVPVNLDVQSRYGNNNLAFIGEYIYLANGSILEILDNHNPANPFIINQIHFPLPNEQQQLAVAGNHLAAIVESHGGGTEVQTLTIDAAGHMGDLEPLPQTNYSRLADDLAIVGDYLYTTHFPFGPPPGTEPSTTLNIYDIRRINDIGSHASLSPHYIKSRRIAANSTHLFLLYTSQSNYVHIMDISNPYEPILTSHFFLQSTRYQSLRDLAVWEDTLYLVSFSPNGVVQVDISNIQRPQFLGFFPYDAPYSITVGDGYLFVLNQDDEISIIDLHSASGPFVKETFRLNSVYPNDLVYRNGTLYVALSFRGVAAVKLNLDNLR